MTLAKREGFIWLDGVYLPWHKAQAHVLTHSLHYGVGVFEGVRAYQTDKGTAIFHLHAHTDRLFRSAHILNITLPYSKDELNTVQLEVLKRNNLLEAYIRPMVFYGAEYLGLQTDDLSIHVMVGAWQWENYFKTGELTGIKVHTSAILRNSPSSIFTKAKANGNYINSIMALQEARSLGCDEALMLDHHGYIAESSSANVFLVKRGKLLTPGTGTILEGITRETVMTLARDLGLEVKECDLTRDDVYTADEMFFTGTAAELTPVRMVDSRLIADGEVGPLTKQIHQLYRKVVQGKEDKYADWLTYT